MNTDEIIRILCGALAGGFLTALIFVFAQVQRLASIEANLGNLTKAFSKHVETPNPQCQFHANQVTSLAVIEVEQKTILGRMDKFESNIISRLEKLEDRE
jgi:hypothetical protein